VVCASAVIPIEADEGVGARFSTAYVPSTLSQQCDVHVDTQKDKEIFIFLAAFRRQRK